MTYVELKEMPIDSRVIALKELQSKYSKDDGSPDVKAIGTLLGVNPVAIAGMFARDVNGMKAGRKKTEPEIVQPNVEPKKRGRKPKDNVINMTENKPPETKSEPVKEETKVEYTVDQKATFKFKTEIEGVMPSIEAQKRINGIAGSLLEGKTYNIKLVIEEV